MRQSLFIYNGKVVTPFEVIEDGEVLVGGDTILAVAEKGVIRKPRRATAVNAKGCLVVPGFIDVHLQGAGGADVLDATRKALRTIARTLARNGTTAFLATTVATGKKSPHLGVVDEVMKRGTGGAHLLGIHLEGPFINLLRKGMIKSENIKHASARGLQEILRQCKGRLAMMTVAPEVRGALTVIRKLRNRGIVVSFGHSDATYRQAVRGIKCGITHVTHLFNAMPSLHHRQPGPLPAIIEAPQCTVQVITDGIHLHPAVVRLLLKAIGIERMVLITDAMSATGLRAGRYTYNGMPYHTQEGAARYTDGTLIGTALTLRQMVARFIAMTGVSVHEAVAAASLNPARVLGIANKKGSIAPGKDADIVIVDERFNVKKVFIGGKIVR